MMDRRRFLASVALSAAGLQTHSLWGAEMRRRLPLAFSTLGCPDWSWRTILDYAAEYGYSAIELRTLEGTEDLPRRPEFAPGQIRETGRQLAARNLRIASVDSSANMHEGDPQKRTAQLEEGRRFVDLAHALGAPYVRVFGDKYPEGEPRGEVLTRVAAGLRQLGQYAGTRGVTVLLESHGDFTDSAALLAIMQLVNSPHVAILWDAHHTYVTAGEAPEYTFRQLGRYIRHTHLKDSIPIEKGRSYVLTGAGDVPVKQQVEVLARGGYRGLYSFEWEKRWHPEIAEPEIAIPHYSRVMHDYMAELGAPSPALPR